MKRASTRKDLVEVFGYAPDDTTPAVRGLWNLGACPFVNKACGKTNHDASVTYGTCSVTTPEGDCIICPNRLYQDDYAILRKISTEAFGMETEFMMYDAYIKRRAEGGNFVVALGLNSGREVKLRGLSMDWILARIQQHRLVEYVGVEVQSIDITGNYRDAWYAYKNLAQAGTGQPRPASAHGLNWANVHKRLIPQIIRKGVVYSNSKLVRAGLHFVLPEIVYRKFEQIIGPDIPLLSHPGAHVLTIHTYDLSPPVPHGQQRTLINTRNIRVDLNEFAWRFIAGPHVSVATELDDAVRRLLGVAE